MGKISTLDDIYGKIYIFDLLSREQFSDCTTISKTVSLKTVFSKQADLITTKPTKPLKNVSDRMSREPVGIVG